MGLRWLLPLFVLFSTASLAVAADTPIERCVEMRLDADYAPRVGYALKRMKLRDIDIPDADVTVQPRMAGLLGPNVTFFGRDVRLAVIKSQSSPQELWRTARWNEKSYPCAPVKQSWATSLTRGIHWNGVFENSVGFTTYEPKILYRTRFLFKSMIVRPYGFTFGSAIAAPLSTNTETLLMLGDPRAPVRRDMARFATGFSFDELYASWRTTPVTDLHMAFSAGLLEEMYGGAGAELVYRPFGSPFWFGADGWQVWRRDADSAFNMHLENGADFTGHVRVGYDKPDTRFSVQLAAGQYLAGDTGLSMQATQSLDNGARFTASLTWTSRDESEGFFKNSHYDPMIRIVWPLGSSGKYTADTHFMQMGRDGGQMLNRPMPLEEITEAFSAREIIRNWVKMFE